MKARISSLILSFIFLFINSVNAESIKIGFININKITENSSLYNVANDRLTKEFEPKQKELFDLLEHINLLKKNLNTNSKINNADEKQRLDKIQILENQLNTEAMIWQQELNEKQILLIKEIEEIINKAVNSFAIREKYDLILYENSAFVSEKIDLTDEIIMELDKFKL